ncbi:hypothetical protein [Stieleria marina]|uniref:SprT-like family protein n=1 Tax=Stieleria marina TaxID=1930275 RepID=A0A517NZ06_9BACT|nr:hypothetical protein K239x_43420 [Planctomycetes bacterium K23_9]
MTSSKRPTGSTTARSAKKPSRPSATGTIRPRDPAKLSSLAGEVALRKFKRADVHRWQQEIHDQTLMLSRTIDRPNFSRVSNDDVSRMIRMYDDRFFDGKVLPLARAEGMKFALSSRMTSIAGKLVTHYPEGTHSGRRSFELVLSTTLLFQTFEDVSRPVEVTGRLCKDRLEAMQRIAEHEFVHLIEMLIWNDGNCSESRFQSIALRYFDHTDFRHDLITQRERAARKFDVRVGDQVRFARDGHYLIGRVNRITRRATVLVPNPEGEKFADGKRYVRYYVPLEKLQRVRAR